MVDDDLNQLLDDLQKKIDDKVAELEGLRNSSVYILYLTDTKLNNALVDIIYDDLRKKYGASQPENLDVVLNSGGGLIDPAYNIALLFRRFVKKEFRIIVPRWAKSAATLLACAGDAIHMTPIAELGPVDPQCFLPAEFSPTVPERFSSFR